MKKNLFIELAIAVGYLGVIAMATIYHSDQLRSAWTPEKTNFALRMFCIYSLGYFVLLVLGAWLLSALNCFLPKKRKEPEGIQNESLNIES